MCHHNLRILKADVSRLFLCRDYWKISLGLELQE